MHPIDESELPMTDKVATSSEAGRAVASNLHARRQQAAADAKRDSESLFGDKPDTTTPLVGKAPMADVPDPPKAKPVIVLSTTVAYRGRIITVSNEGMTLDAFCDMLDKKFGVAE